jgi:hypothetical protein
MYHPSSDQKRNLCSRCKCHKNGSVELPTEITEPTLKLRLKPTLILPPHQHVPVDRSGIESSLVERLLADARKVSEYRGAHRLETRCSDKGDRSKTCQVLVKNIVSVSV